jgi:hypothetical protein
MLKKKINCGKVIALNKFIVVGDVHPNDMNLPVVIDIKKLQELFTDIGKKICVGMDLKIKQEKFCKGILEIEVVKEK